MSGADLSPRMEQVCVLVGRDRLSYKAVARELGISWHTVRGYAEEVRARTESDHLSPRDACTAHYWRHRDEFDGY